MAGSLARLASLGLLEPSGLDRAALRRLVDAASDDDLAAWPGAALHIVREVEPGNHFELRTMTLERLARAVADDPGAVVLHSEIAAERAIGPAIAGRLDEAEAAARLVLDGPALSPLALARATEALGRVLAWRGSEQASLQGEALLHRASELYRELDQPEWEGWALGWIGNASYFQRGDLDRAAKAMRDSLDLLDPRGVRGAIMRTFYADVVGLQGRTVLAEAALDRAAAVGVTTGEEKVAAYVAWSRARIASRRGDHAATRRAVTEVERHLGAWASITSGTTFLADAAELLDHVGDTSAAAAYLARAEEREPDDEFVSQARATFLARHGDPLDALAALRALPQNPWLELHLQWRHALFTAWATLRARHAGVGALAARALDLAEATGGAEMALLCEPTLVRALAPAALGAGSPVAVRILAPETGLILRVLGEVSLTCGIAPVELPTGAAGVLLRLLAVRPGGVSVDAAVDVLWPRSDLETGRRQLRDTLARLRRRIGDVVVRRGDHIRLAQLWVDAVAFKAAADAALGASGEDAVPLATAAVALWAGHPLPSDPYADWAETAREPLRRRYLDLLDLLAADALRRESLEEAAALLEEAIETDPAEEQRYVTLARLEFDRGRRARALDALARARRAAADLGLRASRAVDDLAGLIATS